MKTSCTLVSTEILLLLTVVAVAHCYRNGVRGQSCVDMKPGHGTAQNTTSPYVLEVKRGATTYSAGKELRGELASTASVVLCRFKIIVVALVFISEVRGGVGTDTGRRFFSFLLRY